MPPRALPALVLICFAGAATAQAIHKCRDAEGRIAYQDQPCPVEALPLPPIDAPPSDPYVPDLAAKGQPAAPSDAPSADAGVPPAPPLPVRYRCTREDGEGYISSDPSPPPRYVPAWAVGATSSSSNLPRTPARQAWDRNVGGAYVRVQDRCVPLGRADLCAHWRERFDAARRGRQAAFFDERRALERETIELRTQLQVHCGR